MDVFVHWLHLMAAILWVGGTFTMSLAVQPILRKFLKDSTRFEIYREIGARFKIIMWGCWTTLLLTGLYKLWEIRETPAIFLGAWGRIFAIKMVLVALMVILTLLHTYVWGPQMLNLKDPAQIRTVASKMKIWGTVNLFVLTGIIFCAAALRFSGW
jgi:putative copper export protein